MSTGGKAGGGSSSTNGLYYARGSASVYDDWVTLGNPGWGWEDVYPLFVKVPILINSSENLRYQWYLAITGDIRISTTLLCLFLLALNHVHVGCAFWLL